MRQKTNKISFKYRYTFGENISSNNKRRNEGKLLSGDKHNLTALKIMNRINNIDQWNLTEIVRKIIYQALVNNIYHD